MGLEAPFSLAFHGRAAPLAAAASLAHRSFRRCPGSKAVVSKSTLHGSRSFLGVDRDSEKKWSSGMESFDRKILPAANWFRRVIPSQEFRYDNFHFIM